ncbi:MAG TPA: hypothetical protein VL357_02090 [Rariglobus sp.]|jgi:hypothetical protein|nr:hypothetical protein [Rariglobus sp.]
MSSSSHLESDKSSHEFVKQSSLYQEFLAEREEILRHKWIESERLGYDIGFERALLDWIRKHRESWRASRRPSSGKSNTPFNKQATAHPSASKH